MPWRGALDYLFTCSVDKKETCVLLSSCSMTWPILTDTLPSAPNGYCALNKISLLPTSDNMHKMVGVGGHVNKPIIFHGSVIETCIGCGYIKLSAGRRQMFKLLRGSEF